MNHNCPICLENYYDIEKCGNVCSQHQDWVITICECCEKACFSDVPGICFNCLEFDDFDYADLIAKE